MDRWMDRWNVYNNNKISAISCSFCFACALYRQNTHTHTHLSREIFHRANNMAKFTTLYLGLDILHTYLYRHIQIPSVKSKSKSKSKRERERQAILGGPVESLALSNPSIFLSFFLSFILSFSHSLIPFAPPFALSFWNIRQRKFLGYFWGYSEKRRNIFLDAVVMKKRRAGLGWVGLGLWSLINDVICTGSMSCCVYYYYYYSESKSSSRDRIENWENMLSFYPPTHLPTYLPTYLSA